MELFALNNNNNHNNNKVNIIYLEIIKSINNIYKLNREEIYFKINNKALLNLNYLELQVISLVNLHKLQEITQIKYRLLTNNKLSKDNFQIKFHRHHCKLFNNKDQGLDYLLNHRQHKVSFDSHNNN